MDQFDSLHFDYATPLYLHTQALTMFVNASLWIRRFGLGAAMLLAVCLMGCHSSLRHDSSPIVQSYAWKMVANSQATLADIEATGNWHDFDGMQSWGFGQESVWIRYTLRSALPGETEPWILTIRPPYLEYLTLYDPENHLELRSGSMETKPDNALSSINFTFQIPATPYERSVYLRLRSERSRTIAMDVLPWREAASRNQSIEWLLGSLISISFALTLWALIQWLLERERVIGAFAFKQFFITLWAFSLQGFDRVLLGSFINPPWLNALNIFITNGAIFSTFLYLLLLLMDYRPFPIWLKVCRTYLVGLLLLPLMLLLGLTMEIRIVIVLAAPIGLLLIGLTLMTSPKLNSPYPISRSFLTAYILSYFSLSLFPAAILLGWTPWHPMLVNANLAYLFLDGLPMFLLLQWRARNLAAHAQQMVEHNQAIARQLDLTQQEIAFEQKRRQEQSQFLHMLMHELKTPLSIISLALGNRNKREENLAHASHAVQDMKAIIDRCVTADQVGGLSLTQQCKSVDVVQLIRQHASNRPRLGSRLHLMMASELPMPHTDEQLLQIILTNLLDNAAHYSDPLMPVTVELTRQERDDQAGLCTHVRNVPGLAGWPDPEEVFSKYYRASGAQRESGSGLGLYLSRQLANSLGGSLTYEPHDQYVEFVLWIPLNSA